VATIRFTDLIEPMDLANMRADGVRSLDVQCHDCRHRAIMNVDHLPGDPMMCGRTGKNVKDDAEWEADAIKGPARAGPVPDDSEPPGKARGDLVHCPSFWASMSIRENP
jgi:hypothetical protein